MKKNVIFFSNPFGFGPTAKVVALINTCVKFWDANLYYVASSDCLQIFEDKRVQIISADQRNPDEINKILSTIPDPHVVSSLNRFAVKTAHALKIPNCFIDSLTWMWDKIPEDYLLTDLYFALNFPGLEQKLNTYPSIIKVPYIVDKIKSNKTYLTSDLMVNIGGCMNPLTKSCPKSFLTLLAESLNQIKNKKILVCGGSEAINFIKQHVLNENISCITLKKDVFLSSLLHTKLFLTTSGLNATLEAFTYGIPTGFIMPTNLSQWENLQIFTKYDAAHNKIEWEDIISQNDIGVHGKTEREAIQIIMNIADNVLNTNTLKQRTIALIKKASELNCLQNFQNKFVKSLGVDGADVIARILKDKWGL